MIKILNISLFLIFGLTAILSQVKMAFGQAPTEILIVADQKASCRGIAVEDCLQVKHLNEADFSLFRQKIAKFNYTAGYFYVLEVQTVKVTGTPAGASNIKYRLKRILAREKSAEKTNVPTGTNFYRTEWRLTKIDGAPVKNEKAFIKFDEQQKSAGGNGGCNGFGGTLEVTAETLRISQIISTQMFCEETSPIERKIFDGLEKATGYQIIDHRLQLWSENKPVLEFEAK